MSQGFIDDDDDDDEPAMPRKKRPEEEMDITPMIDITFLLLIFFVVASKMDPTQTGKIPEATNGLAISAKDSAVIFIEPPAVIHPRFCVVTTVVNSVKTKRPRPVRSLNTSLANWRSPSGQTRTK